MTNAKARIGRKAAKAVVKHSAHGTASKVRRDPARATTLLGLGAAVGVAVGYLVGRRSAAPAAPAPVAQPHDAGPAATPVRSTPA